MKVAASTVWEILREAGIDPAPERASSTWADFLRSQADALLACDFLETVTLTGARMYVLAVIEHASRRIRILGATAHPTASWVAQVARNLVMDLEDAGSKARYLIRDRDGKFPALFDAVLADAGIKVVLSGVQMPRMNSIMERWVRTCRRELLDRTLIPGLRRGTDVTLPPRRGRAFPLPGPQDSQPQTEVRPRPGVSVPTPTSWERPNVPYRSVSHAVRSPGACRRSQAGLS